MEETLFPDMSDPTVKLYSPTPKLLAAKAEAIGRYLDITRLNDLLKDIKKAFSAVRIEFYNSNGVRCDTPKAWNGFLRPSASKQEKCQALAFITGEARNIRAYFEKLPDSIRKMWLLLLRNYRLDIRDAEYILGFRLSVSDLARRGRGYADIYVHESFPFFSFYNRNLYAYRPQITDVALIRCLRQDFARALLEDSWGIPGGEPEEGETVFCGEEEMSNLYPALEVLYQNKVLALSQNKVNDSTVKSIRMSTAIPEIFNHKAHANDMPAMRAFLLLNFVGVSLSFQRRPKRCEPRALFQSFCSAMASTPGTFFSIFTKHLKNIAQNCRKTNPIPLVDLIVDSLRVLPRGEWHHFESLFCEMNMRDERETLLFFEQYGIQGFYAENKLTDCDLDYRDIMDQLVFPAVKMFVAMIAAAGGAEIAYGEPSENPTSYADRLTRFRLTPLGEYMLGFSDSYTMKSPKKYRLELSEDSLIITVEGENNPLASVAASMAAPIGRNRFKTNEALMMRGCDGWNEIMSRREMLEKSGGKLPENWKAFFDGIQLRCNPLNPVSSYNYEIFRVGSENIPLQQLLCSDKTLSKLIIRAEDYMILVDKDDLSAFKKRLRDLGYII